MEELVNNEALHRFEMQVEGQTARIDYKRGASRLSLLHTEVPAPLRGRGVAAGLVTKAFQYIAAKGWKIVPICSYIQSFLRKHPEWEYLVDKDIRAKGYNAPTHERNK